MAAAHLSTGNWHAARLIDDRSRCRAVGVPDSVEFATKPQLARRMLERALDAGVPCGGVTGDEVYGGDRSLRLRLSRARNRLCWRLRGTNRRGSKAPLLHVPTGSRRPCHRRTNQPSQIAMKSRVGRHLARLSFACDYRIGSGLRQNVPCSPLESGETLVMWPRRGCAIFA
jgi:hypothetical protein